MILGFIEIDGRRYRIRYAEPDESDIDSEFKKLRNSAGENYHDEIDREKYMDRAKALAQAKKFEEASKIAYSMRSTIEAKILESKAEPGISQRRTAEISVEGISQGALKSIELVEAKEGDSPVVIPNDVVKTNLESLVNKLNKENYDRHANAEFKTAKSDVDLRIPTPDYAKSYSDQIEDLAYWFSGSGNKDHQFALEMSRLNRFNKSMLPPNRELVGYTFITRPHCNFANENLANVRDFAPLLYCHPNSIQMAIRQSLDTEFAYDHGGDFICPLVDRLNPFLVMMCNSLRSINNFPDPTLSIETSEGGFFSEQQSNVIGYDRMAKGQDLQLQFRDYIGSPVMSAIDYWVKYMGYVQDGTMHQYRSDIEHNLLGYSVSIYRFVMDYTGRRITKWAKATGCWPKMSPMGTVFNINAGDVVVAASKDEFSIPWQASVFEYNDPEILRDFNILVRRYCKSAGEGEEDGKTGDQKDLLPDLRANILNNRAGIPYVTFRYGAPELIWKVPTSHSEGGEGVAVKQRIVGNVDYKEPKDPNSDYFKFPH